MFNQSVYNVDEDAGPAQPVLVLTNPSSSDITVQVITEDGSATGEYCSIASTNCCSVITNVTGGGVDYTSRPYNVTFPAGVTMVTFDVPINDDNKVEGNEIFNLTLDLSSLPSVVTTGIPLQATVTIADDDCKCQSVAKSDSI